MSKKANKTNFQQTKENSLANQNLEVRESKSDKNLQEQDSKVKKDHLSKKEHKDNQEDKNSVLKADSDSKNIDNSQIDLKAQSSNEDSSNISIRKNRFVLPKLKTFDLLMITICLLLFSSLLLTILTFNSYNQVLKLNFLQQKVLLEENTISNLSKENKDLKEQVANLQKEKQNSQQTESKKTFTLEKPDFQKDHWLGNKDAKIVWLVYSDYQCPFCKKIHPDLLKLQANNSDLAIVFRHLPLTSIHPFSIRIAEASECIALENKQKFWDFTNTVFAKEENIANFQDLSNLLKTLGLDSAQVQECLQSKKFEQKILNTANEHIEAGLKSTPTSIIFNLETNTAKILPGALEYQDLQKVLQEVRDAKK